VASLDVRADVPNPSQAARADPQVGGRRFPSAFLVLGVLSLLAAGAVALGVVQSPTTTDLAVHNGAHETLAASQVDGHFTASYLGGDVVSFQYRPGSTTELARGPHGAVKAKRTVRGANAVTILEPVQALLAIHHFSQHGSLFESTEPAADLAPAGQRSLVTGTYHTAVRMAGGYVVGVSLAIHAKEGGQTIDYHLTRVGGWGTT
jgi:hypothetical protein